MIKSTRWFLPVRTLALRWVAVSMLGLFCLQAYAQETPTPAREAVRTCTKCHDENEAKPVLSILKSKHAVMADSRTPFADQSCMTCHGKSEAHMQAPAEGAKRVQPDVVFDRDSKTPVALRNQTCLNCHEKGLRMHWKGSRHETANVDCASCHVAHTQSDPILAKETEAEACFGCHKGRRAEMLRPSTHPMREGQVSCSGCHDPHGSAGPKLLTKQTVNETCYTCHADKRGPFLWEHQPVGEDCTLCHKPHGSAQPAMLTQRSPFLCQQCHQAQGHPSVPGLPSGLPDGSPSVTLLASGCANCHSQVHGSNHPSGARLTR